MKTRELIRLLSEADPGGDAECCIDNSDILCVELMPAWYDGRLEILDRDKSIKGYDVIGARVVSSGLKIKIRRHSIEDMILVSHELPVDLSDIKNERITQEYYASIMQMRQDAITVKHDVALWSFTAFVKAKIEKMNLQFSDADIENAARVFFDSNLSDDDAMPDDIRSRQLSWFDARHMQWDRELAITVSNGLIDIRRV